MATFTKDITGIRTQHPMNPNADVGLPCNYQLTIEIKTDDGEAYINSIPNQIKVISGVPTIEIDCIIEDRPGVTGKVNNFQVEILNSEIMTDVGGDSYVNHDDIELNTEVVAYCTKGGVRDPKTRGFILKDSN